MQIGLSLVALPALVIKIQVICLVMRKKISIQSTYLIFFSLFITSLVWNIAYSHAAASWAVDIDAPCADARAEEGDECGGGDGICRPNDIDELVCTAAAVEPADESFVVASLNGPCCPHAAYSCCEDAGLCAGRGCGPEEVSPAPGVCTLTETDRLVDGQSTCVGTSGPGEETPDDGPSANLRPRYLENPLGTASVAEIIARIISIITGVSGSIALLMFVYGGMLWLTAGGESGKIEAGRKAMIWAVIGLVVIFGAYAILSFLFRELGATALL
jgi:hypothetical protein